MEWASATGSTTTSCRGRPDLVFSGRWRIILIHGCYWHHHDGCAVAHVPRSNLAYWIPKLERNRQRDAENLKKLRAAGMEGPDCLGMPIEESAAA